MRLAVASSDGKMVNQHFGKARQFYIFEADRSGVRLLEIRKSQPPCGTAEYGHRKNPMECALNLISDCQAVFCSRIGESAKNILLECGIEPVEAPDFILDAISKFFARKEKG